MQKGNLSIVTKGSRIVIEIDASRQAIKASPISRAGNSRLVASTKGFTQISVNGETLKLNLNVCADLEDDDVR